MAPTSSPLTRTSIDSAARSTSDAPYATRTVTRRAGGEVAVAALVMCAWSPPRGGSTSAVGPKKCRVSCHLVNGRDGFRNHDDGHPPVPRQRVARAAVEQLTERVERARSDNDELSVHLRRHVSENDRRGSVQQSPFPGDTGGGEGSAELVAHLLLERCTVLVDDVLGNVHHVPSRCRDRGLHGGRHVNEDNLGAELPREVSRPGDRVLPMS